MSPSGRCIDVTGRVERSDEFIAVPPECDGTRWNGEIEPDAPERVWKDADGLASLHRKVLTRQAAVGQNCR
jgi:hypothetical protein